MSQTLFSAFKREKLLLPAEHLQPIKEKKKSFPLVSQSKFISSLSSQSDLFTFLKSDLNKAPELGELPGKPYTRVANF